MDAAIRSRNIESRKRQLSWGTICFNTTFAPTTYSLARKILALALPIVLSIGFSVKGHAQLPPEVQKAAKELIEKLGQLKNEQKKLFESVREIDGLLAPFRAEDDDSMLNVADHLAAWIKSFSEAKKKQHTDAPRLLALYDTIATMKSQEKLPARAERLAKELVATLDGTLTIKENEDLTKNNSLIAASARLDQLLAARGLKIHVVDATYGDHSTGRICSALPYLRAICEGNAKCPAAAATAPIDVTGENLCKYEPAPLAPAEKKEVHIWYSCVYLGIKPWEEINKEQKSGKPHVFVGKARLACQ